MLPNTVKRSFASLQNWPENGTYLPCSAVIVLSLTAVHLPRSGLAGLRPGEAGLHTEQQAQGDPPGDAVGRCAWRLPARGGGRGGLPRGQSIVTV